MYHSQLLIGLLGLTPLCLTAIKALRVFLGSASPGTNQVEDPIKQRRECGGCSVPQISLGWSDTQGGLKRALLQWFSHCHNIPVSCNQTRLIRFAADSPGCCKSTSWHLLTWQRKVMWVNDELACGPAGLGWGFPSSTAKCQRVALQRLLIFSSGGSALLPSWLYSPAHLLALAPFGPSRLF